jgi:hypothetical protein
MIIVAKNNIRKSYHPSLVWSAVAALLLSAGIASAAAGDRGAAHQHDVDILVLVPDPLIPDGLLLFLGNLQRETFTLAPVRFFSREKSLTTPSIM